jgi:hypothetical protein
MQLRDQDFAQHRAGVGLGAHIAAGHPGPQRADHRLRHDRAEVGDQQGVLDVLPGVLVEVTAAEQAEHAAAQRVLRLGEAPAQAVQPAVRRSDGVERRFDWRGFGRRDWGFGRRHRGFGEHNVGDGPFRRIPGDGGIIADGGQPAGVDALDRLSGSCLRECDA